MDDICEEDGAVKTHDHFNPAANEDLEPNPSTQIVMASPMVSPSSSETDDHLVHMDDDQPPLLPSPEMLVKSDFSGQDTNTSGGYIKEKQLGDLSRDYSSSESGSARSDSPLNDTYQEKSDDYTDGNLTDTATSPSSSTSFISTPFSPLQSDPALTQEAPSSSESTVLSTFPEEDGNAACLEASPNSAEIARYGDGTSSQHAMQVAMVAEGSVLDSAKESTYDMEDGEDFNIDAEQKTSMGPSEETSAGSDRFEEAESPIPSPIEGNEASESAINRGSPSDSASPDSTISGIEYNNSDSAEEGVHVAQALRYDDDCGDDDEIKDASEADVGMPPQEDNMTHSERDETHCHDSSEDHQEEQPQSSEVSLMNNGDEDEPTSAVSFVECTPQLPSLSSASQASPLTQTQPPVFE